MTDEAFRFHLSKPDLPGWPDTKKTLENKASQSMTQAQPASTLIADRDMLAARQVSRSVKIFEGFPGPWKKIRFGQVEKLQDASCTRRSQPAQENAEGRRSVSVYNIATHSDVLP